MDELREMMNAAYDKQEAEMQKEPQDDEIEAVEEPQSEEPASEPVEPEAAQAEETSEPRDPPKSEKNTVEEKDKTPTEEAPKEEKAPASWSARARESWAKLPAEAKAEVAKREKEINRVLQESATARRAASELQQVLAPHSQRLMQSGVQNPIQAIGTLLATEGQLRQGDQMTKAHTIANLIKQYAVDIGTLDGVLSNEPQQQRGALSPDIDSLLNERLAPFQQFISQQQQQQQMEIARRQQEAQQSVTQFSENAEFLNDVRLDMADLMDMAAARGQEMSLEEAYKKACAMHPDVSKVVEQRQRQQAMMGSNQAAQAKRNAAVSIKGHQSGQTARGTDNLRDQIANAWADTMGG